MRLIPNSGADRVIDLARPHLKADIQLGCVTTTFSLFAYAELRDALVKLEGISSSCRPVTKRWTFWVEMAIGPIEIGCMHAGSPTSAQIG